MAVTSDKTERIDSRGGATGSGNSKITWILITGLVIFLIVFTILFTSFFSAGGGVGGGDSGSQQEDRRANP